MDVITQVDNGNPAKWLILVASCFIVFCVAFTTTAVMNSLPVISKLLNMTPDQLQWVVNAYTLASAILIILAGQLGDMMRYRYVLYAGGLIFFITSLIIATTHSGTEFIAGRFFQGMGAALLLPNSLSILKVSFPERQVKLAVSIWAGVVSLGFAMGPLLGGILTAAWSWRLIFWSSLILLLIGILCIVFTPKNPKSNSKKKPFFIDVIGFLLLGAGLICFILGLSQANSWGWSSPLTIILVIVGLLIFVGFCFFERRFERPLVRLSHFSKRQFVAGIVCISMAIALINSVLYFFNIYIQSSVLLYYSPIQAGLALLPTSVAVFLLSFITVKLAQWIGYRWLCGVAFLLAAVGFALLALVGVNTSYSDLWFPLLLIGVGAGICFSCGPAIGMSALADKHAGEASGLLNMSMYLLITLTIAIGTTVFLYAGRFVLYHGLNVATNISQMIKIHIDKILLGHLVSVQQILNDLTNLEQKQIHTVAQQAILSSFHAVMWVQVIVSVVAAILMFTLVKGKE